MNTAYKVKQTEAELMKLIREQLTLMGFYVVRVNVGSVKTEDGRWFSSGVPKGFSDLLAVKDGRAHFVEVKIKPNTPSVEQKRFIADMRAMGCRAGVAYSLEDAEKIVKGEKR